MPISKNPVTLPSDPTLGAHAANKSYVDTGLAGKASVSHTHDEGGGTGFVFEPYEHTQGTAASTWSVEHNLGRYPIAWSLYDSDGNECDEYTIHHIDLDNLQVSMDVATAGLIRMV